MIFGNTKINCDINICISGISINIMYMTTFWGVIIDDKLNWKEHIKIIQSKPQNNCNNLQSKPRFK